MIEGVHKDKRGSLLQTVMDQNTVPRSSRFTEGPEFSGMAAPLPSHPLDSHFTEIVTALLRQTVGDHAVPDKRYREDIVQLDEERSAMEKRFSDMRAAAEERYRKERVALD